MSDDSLDPVHMAADPTACTSVLPFRGAQVCGHHAPGQLPGMEVSLTFSAGPGRVSSSILLTTDQARQVGMALVAMADATAATREIVAEAVSRGVYR